MEFSSVSQPGRDEQCWEDLKSETGFTTYREYLEAYGYEFESNDSTLGLYYEQQKVANPVRRVWCSVFDLLEDASLSCRLALYGSRPEEHALGILKVIRDPNAQIVLRVVLLDRIGDDTRDCIPGRVLDAIGLGLRVPSEFFEAFFADKIESGYHYKRSMKTEYGKIGGAIFLKAQNYLLERSSPPVMLIMGNPLEHGNAPKQPAPFTTNLRWELQKDGAPQWPKSYELLFRAHAERYKITSSDVEAASSHSLLPLLEVHLYDLRNVFDDAQTAFSNRRDDSSIFYDVDSQRPLERIRYNLRCNTRDFEYCMNSYIRYLRRNSPREFIEHESCIAIKEDARVWLDDTRNLEAEIRDWLQLQVGSLALQDAKKSIEMSNLQIEESRRGEIELHYKPVFWLMAWSSRSEDW